HPSFSSSPAPPSTNTYTRSLHDALPILNGKKYVKPRFEKKLTPASKRYSQFYLRLHVKDELGAFATISELFNQEGISLEIVAKRSEEHTSELQSRFDLVCRLLLEKEKDA